jgi:hypothetical protein
MISESASSVHGRASPGSQQLELRTDVSSNFTIALDNPASPANLLVEVEFRAGLRLPDSEDLLFTYVAKHVAQFKIVGATGFDDWAAIPEGALGPYLAITNALAQRSAERTILDMGLRGVALPRATQFDEYSNARAGDLADPVTTP